MATSIGVSTAPLPQVILPPEWKSCPMPSTALESIRNAAEGGEAFAQWRMGKFCAHDAGDLISARAWYEKSAAQDHPLALHEIGYLLHTRRSDAADRKRGIECYTKAAEAGLTLAQLNLGIAMLWDQDYNPTKRLGVDWLAKAAASEPPSDELLLRVTRPTVERIGWQSVAIEWVRWTFQYSQSHALYETRTTFLPFNGLADSQEAANLALEAYAQAGYRDAMRDLGRRLRRGRKGFRRVPATALMWLRKAGTAGDQRAMSETAEMLLESKLPDDQNEALRLATMTQNIAQSKYLLGIVCAEGQAGRRKDEQKAVEYFAAAAAGGSKRAKSRLGCKACPCTHLPISKRGPPSVPDATLGPRINRAAQLEWLRRVRKSATHLTDGKTTSFSGSKGAVFAVRLKGNNGSPTSAATNGAGGVAVKFVVDEGDLKNNLENHSNFLAEPTRLGHPNVARVLGHFHDEIPQELPDFDRVNNETKKTLFVMMPLYPFTLRELIQYRFAKRRRSSAGGLTAGATSAPPVIITSPAHHSGLGGNMPPTPSSNSSTSTLHLSSPLLSPSSRVPHAHVAAAANAAAQAMSASQLFSEAEIVHLSMQLCSALNHLYNNGVVHRSVTPDHIFLQPPNDFKDIADMTETAVLASRLVLSEFGEAYNFQSSADAKDFRLPYIKGVNKGGNPAYLAPEVARAVPVKGAILDYSKCDAFSLGRVIWDLMSHAEPFAPPTTAMEANPQVNDEAFAPLAKMYSKPLMVMVRLLLAIPIGSRITLREAHYYMSRQWAPMKCTSCNHDHWDQYNRTACDYCNKPFSMIVNRASKCDSCAVQVCSNCIFSGLCRPCRWIRTT